MEGLYLFNVIVWTACGIINLSCKEISKVSYALMWVVLMINLVGDCIRAFAG